jgi:hypothetical protein
VVTVTKRFGLKEIIYRKSTRSDLKSSHPNSGDVLRG